MPMVWPARSCTMTTVFSETGHAATNHSAAVRTGSRSSWKPAPSVSSPREACAAGAAKRVGSAVCERATAMRKVADYLMTRTARPIATTTVADAANGEIAIEFAVPSGLDRVVAEGEICPYEFIHETPLRRHTCATMTDRSNRGLNAGDATPHLSVEPRHFVVAEVAEIAESAGVEDQSVAIAKS